MIQDKNTEFENAVKSMMLHVGENPQREGLQDTPTRVRKAYEFIYGGYKENPKEILEKDLHRHIEQLLLRFPEEDSLLN